MKWLQDLLAVGIKVQVELKIGLDTADDDEKKHVVSCMYCDWKKAYTTKETAGRGLRAHEQHCSKRASALQWMTGEDHEQHSSNGHK